MLVYYFIRLIDHLGMDLLKIYTNFLIRGHQWILTKSIRMRRCHVAWYAFVLMIWQISNQFPIHYFSTKNWSRASFWWFDKIKLFVVLVIWQIRTNFGSNFVKSSKRRTKMTHVMDFLFVVLVIWQIRAKIGPNLSNH